MTALESVNLIRLMLDDSRDYYWSTAMIIKAINEAQIRKIREYNMRDDERALRPLYTQATDIADGDVVVDVNGNSILFPRACRVRQSQTGAGVATAAQGQIAGYLEEDVFFNFALSPDFSSAGSGTAFPRACFFTITKQWNNDPLVLAFESVLRFTGGNNAGWVADLWYIPEPVSFNYVDGDRTADVVLVLPEEYHPEICALAAELLNDLDVNEMGRGEPVYQNQQISLEQVSG